MNSIFVDFSEFVEMLLQGSKSGGKYCFLIGSGASVSSGIPTGREMVKKWFNELKDGKSDEAFRLDIEERIEKILSMHPEYSTEEINILSESLDKYKNRNYVPDISKDQNDYNYIYELRYAYNEEEGKDYFLCQSDNAYPNAGYIALASILCCKSSNADVVITTNFDELIEDACFIFQKKRMLSIEHENMARYATETWNGRPRILKLHRGVALGGLNKKTETEQLSEKWTDAINTILKEYIPIVVGYSGTDVDIMECLEKASLKGIYWCHRYSSMPNERVKSLVDKCKGKMVSIYSADQLFTDLETTLVKKKNLSLNGINIYDPTREALNVRPMLNEAKGQVKKATNDYQLKTNQQIINTYEDASAKMSFFSLILFYIAFLFSITSLMKYILYKEEKKERMYARGFYELGKTYQRREKWKLCLEVYDKIIENPKSELFFKIQAKKNKFDVIYHNEDLVTKDEVTKIAKELCEAEPFNNKTHEILQKMMR